MVISTHPVIYTMRPSNRQTMMIAYRTRALYVFYYVTFCYSILFVFKTSSRPNRKRIEFPTSTVQSTTTTTTTTSGSTRYYCCYIGNMTWWTTDVDLRNAIYADGIDDLVDLKFYENRSNGQSKGYGLAVFSTENALRQCMEKLPLKELHGQPLVVLPYTKTSLAKFEEATRRSDQRQDKKQQSTTDKKGRQLHSDTVAFLSTTTHTITKSCCTSTIASHKHNAATAQSRSANDDIESSAVSLHDAAAAACRIDASA